MGRILSQETFLKWKRREKTIVGLDKAFQKLGYHYFYMSPNIMDKPWLCQGKKPHLPLRPLGINEAKALLKKWEKEGKKKKK